MTSYTNPDVDRVSLDRRVSALEDKFGISGPGGGSGGGAGPGVSGGGVNGSFVGDSIVTGVVDFDLYPDNTWTVAEKGLIFKFTIDNSTPGSNLPVGVEIKACGMFHTFYQYMLFGPLRPFAIARVKIDTPVTRVLSGRINLSNQNLMEYFNNKLNVGILGLMFRGLVIKAYDNSLFREVYGVSGGEVFNISVGFNLTDLSPTSNFSLTPSSVPNPLPLGVYYGCSYGLDANNGDVPVGGNLGYGAYVPTPADLPKWFRQFYPQSWHS